VPTREVAMDLETIKTEIAQRFDLLEKERQTLLQRINELSQEQLRLQGEARLVEKLLKENKEKVK